MRTCWSNFNREVSGSVAVIAALGLVVFLGFGALALDGGHLLSMKNELQRAADAGAMAGARALWSMTIGTQPIIDNPPLTPDHDKAVSTALSVATSNNNQVNRARLTADQVTAEAGRWNYTARTFTPGTGPNANAVRVTTRATANMYLAQVLGWSLDNVSATSVAVQDFTSELNGGTLPIAISRYFVNAGSSLFVNFTPDTLDNGAWFTDPPDSANAKTFKDYIDNPGDCPPLQKGDIINLQNGNDTTVLQDLANKLAQHGGTWDVVLPVVDTYQFVGQQPITGFVGFRITRVDDTGDTKGVTGTILGLYESPSAVPGNGDTVAGTGVLAPVKSVM